MRLNRGKIAELLGCSVTAVDDHVRQGMPGEKPKHRGDQWTFDAATVVRWLRERERKLAIGDVSKIDEREARRRKLAAEAEMAEYDLALKRGRFVTLEDVQRVWMKLALTCRSRLLGIGSKLGPMLAAENSRAECQKLVDDAIHEALRELSSNGIGPLEEEEQDEISAN